ncbi:hypothetical protein SLS58_002509 [Diplodia intermedia]|uniref:Uncharacterized protein n=1 Tax=Diplodia intermedia TaxID=856260 RepID=A0ABR3TYM5_9PEZI
MARDEELGEEEDDDDCSPNGAMDPEKEILKAPPPAYGLWRCSVPINPDLLYWQRVDGGMHPLRQNPASSSPVNANAQPNELLDPFQTPNLGYDDYQQQHQQQGGLHPNREGGEQVPRPPSYVSDDGVRYVVEAAPRPVAPPAHVEDTLSDVHPAYRGGLGIGR